METAAAVRSIFPEAITLLAYSSAKLIDDGLNADYLINGESDTAAYKELLRYAMIVPEPDFLGMEKISDSNATTKIPDPIIKYPIHEIINRAVGNFIKQSSKSSNWREQNCLALGYRSKTSDEANCMRSNANVELFHINSVHPMVTTRAWQLLADRLGEIRLRKMFSL